MAKDDLKGFDPKWKNKNIIWKEIDENQNITFENIQLLYPDKSKTLKPIAKKAVDEADKPRKFLPPEKEMSLSIVMARWPSP